MFTSTRVASQTRFDYLAGGYPLAEFLEGFPSIGRAQAAGALALAAAILTLDYLRVEPTRINFTALPPPHTAAV